MSAYENVVAGKLRLKGRALDVKDGGINKKKKHKWRSVLSSGADRHDQLQMKTKHLYQMQRMWSVDVNGSKVHDGGEYDDDERLTPAERRYMERLREIELERLAKAARKSHRDRIQEFNQYLANLSEHYDIPKVGPG